MGYDLLHFKWVPVNDKENIFGNRAFSEDFAFDVHKSINLGIKRILPVSVIFNIIKTCFLNSNSNTNNNCTFVFRRYTWSTGWLEDFWKQIDWQFCMILPFFRLSSSCNTCPLYSGTITKHIEKIQPKHYQFLHSNVSVILVGKDS